MNATQLDPEPLSPGYFCDPTRTVNVSFLDHTPGVKGLAFAILLRAVEDGCNREWLEEIAEAYEIELPEEFFAKAPVRNLAFDVSAERYVDVDKNPGVKRKKRKFKTLWMEGLPSSGLSLFKNPVTILPGEILRITTTLTSET